MATSIEPPAYRRTTYHAAGFFRVRQLVPDDQEMVTIPIGSSAGEALDLMSDNAFDQLPVVNPRNRVIGTFTYRSFAQGVRHVRAQDDPRTALVDDLVEDLRFARPSDDVEQVLPWIDEDNAVLVGDEERLLAIITAADVSRFLWHRTRPFVLLRDIELATRELMHSACTPDELSECFLAALQEGDGRAPDRRLEDLTLYELHSVLFDKASYGRHFQLTFGRSRQLVQSTLEPVREIRNRVVHFRGEISDEDYNMLVRASTLLRRRVLIREDR